MDFFKATSKSTLAHGFQQQQGMIIGYLRWLLKLGTHPKPDVSHLFHHFHLISAFEDRLHQLRHVHALVERVARPLRGP